MVALLWPSTACKPLLNAPLLAGAPAPIRLNWHRASDKIEALQFYTLKSSSESHYELHDDVLVI